MDGLSNSNYTISDLENLFYVLKKAIDFKSSENERVKKMEIELNYLKRLSSNSGEIFCHCCICNCLFILLINPSYECAICKKDYCQNCIVSFESPCIMDLCKICHYERLKTMKSGKWKSEKTMPFLLNSVRRQNSNQSQDDIDQLYNALTELMQEYTKDGISLTKHRPTKDKQKRDAYVQVDSGRTSPSFESTKSLSIENLSKVPLRKIFSVKKSSCFFGDNFDENLVIYSSPNSNSPMSETTSNRLSSCRRSSRNTITSSQHFNEETFPNENKIDYMMPKNSPLRSSTNSINSQYSMVSELFSNDVVVKGRICLSIDYDIVKSILIVKIICCDNLTIANESENITNAFVKVCLLPFDRSKYKFKTKIHNNTINPKFDEIISFHVDRFALKERTLNISVWHWQKMKANLFLGEVNIALANINLSTSRYCANQWMDLTIRENMPHIVTLYKYIGEVSIGLQFISRHSAHNSQGNFLIHINEARNIHIITGNKKIINAFIICQINGDGQSQRKTTVKKNSANPVWKEIFNFPNTNKSELNQKSIEIIVCNKPSVGKSVPLGKLILTSNCTVSPLPHSTCSSDCYEKDVALWKRFLSSSHNNIYQDYLPLRSIL